MGLCVLRRCSCAILKMQCEAAGTLIVLTNSLFVPRTTYYIYIHTVLVPFLPFMGHGIVHNREARDYRVRNMEYGIENTE